MENAFILVNELKNEYETNNNIKPKKILLSENLVRSFIDEISFLTQGRIHSRTIKYNHMWISLLENAAPNSYIVGE